MLLSKIGSYKSKTKEKKVVNDGHDSSRPYQLKCC